MTLSNFIRVRRVWANSLVFSNVFTSYSVLTTDTVLFADVSGGNGTIVLPSAANASHSFTIKRIEDTPDSVLTITTDDVANCAIDGVDTLELTSGFDAISCVMGNDLNYYTIIYNSVANVDLVSNLNALHTTIDGEITANLAYYTNTAQLTSNYTNTVQLSSNLGNYTNTAQLTSNYPNNSQLSSNLVLYQTTAGLNANIDAHLPNYGGVLNASSLTVGGNLHANSTVLYFSNGTANVLLVNNYISGNGFGLTSLNVPAIIGNSGIVSNSSGIFANLGAGLNFVSGAIAVNANNGIIANSSGVFVLANTGITVNSSGVFGTSAPVGNSGIVSNSSGLFANLGGGLVFVSGAINVNSTNGMVANSTGLWLISNTGIAVNTSGIFGIPLANNGLVSNSTGVFVIANSGLLSNSTGVFVTANSGIVSNSTGVFANIGSGLGFVSGAISVIGNNGIVANSSGIFEAPEFLQLCGGL
jgi:hypothetical protein